jgi:hypothetical protein
MAPRRCAACGCAFEPRRNVPHQRYCSNPVCQRARRRRWQRQKLKTNGDYRANQAAAQRRWAKRHAEYWRRYREGHPGYAEGNRVRQRERNRGRHRGGTGASPPGIVKMDEYSVETPLKSGTYRLTPVLGGGIAKMDAYLVKMDMVSVG